MSWECTQQEKVARIVHAHLNQHPTESNKILFEICQQLDAQPDTKNLSNCSAKVFSSSSDENNNNNLEKNIIDFFHLQLSTFKEDGQN